MIQLTGTSTLTITNTYSVISDTEIQNSIIPSGFAGGTYDVKVTTLAGISLTSANSKYTLVGVTAPVIATITPNTTGYSQSVTVTITGSSFYGGKSSSDVTAIKLYTSPTTTTITGYSVLSDTAINSIVIPNTINAGTYQMKVTSSMGEGSGVDFVVNPPAPVVTAVVSNSGYRHLTNTIGIYGSGFFGGLGSNKVTMLQMTGASTVTITNAYSVVSDTEIQNAVINAGITAGTYDVRVTTDGGTNTTSAIKYVALADTTAPTIVTAVVNTAAVNITFSEDVSLSTATIKGNYKVASPTGGAATDLTSATLTYANNVATITGVSYTQGNTFAVTVTGVQDLAGNAIVSGNVVAGTVTILDGTAPTSCSINVNSGDSYTTSTSVTLTLSASDGTGSGLVSMQISNNGSSWTDYAYATSQTWTLIAGDGSKTVSVRFKDNAGNWSSTATDSITLDTALPTSCSVSINGGAQYVKSTAVTLTLAATATGSGLASMKISNDESTWSVYAYDTSKAWSLNGVTEGSKTVYARFSNNAGNWTTTSVTNVITLDTIAPSGTIIINGGDSYSCCRQC